MTGGLAGHPVLVLNWRDIDHPEAGGAEVYAWELASRFAAGGAEVTYFTARHKGSTAEDVRSGVRVVRRGGRFGVYLRAALHLLRHGRRYAAVLDCQNGIPFFSPAFVPRRCAVVCVIHHVHQHQFALHFPRPVAWLGRLLEKDVARRVYGGRPIIAVSPSTRRNVRVQLRMRGHIHVVTNGVRPLVPGDVARSPQPAITVVSRLVPQKRLDLLVKAVPALRREWPDLVVHIAGTGPERGPLEELVADLGLEGHVQIHGWVDEETKRDLLQQAWLTVMPSVAEGWGLTVVEANSVGTPALAFDVPGLRDSIRHGTTGWLVPEGSDLRTAIAAALQELRPSARREVVAAHCKEWARSFTWERSAARAKGVLATEMLRLRTRGEGSRSPCDLGVLVEGRLSSEAEVGRAPTRALRRTDTAWVSENGVRAMLDGCDEEQALKVMQRFGAVPTDVRLLTASELAVRLPLHGARVSPEGD